MKLSIKEMQILAIILGVWGIILLGSGISLSGSNNKIIKERYSLNIEKKKIAESQAKKNEIKLKNIEIEVNNPISVNVEDYLENVDEIDTETLKELKLDTSLVNINQAGTYQYTIKYNKKKYIANITVKEKELPDVEFTLKNLEFEMGSTLSTNPRSYIEETISDDVYNALSLDLSQVIPSTAGTYQYYITYKGTTYTAQITIKEPGPTIKGPTTITDEDKTTTTEKEESTQ